MKPQIGHIALVEDNEKILHYLAEEIRQQVDVGTLSLFSNGEDALSELTHHEPDIALFDVELPGIDGIESIRRLKFIHPKTQCMVLTVYDKPDIVFEALKAGAISYLLKSTPPDKIMEAIEEVYQGGSPISSQIARKVIEAFTIKEKTNESFQDLSRREQDILSELSKGYRYKEIAHKLNLSLETVRTHVRNIYEKLQVNCRQDALKKTGFL